MFGRLRTVHWLLIIGVLVAVWWFTGKRSPKAQQRTFREALMRTDTGALRAFSVLPAPYKGLPEIFLTRTNSGWRVRMGMDSTAADPEAVNTVLRALHDMRVARVAGGMGSVKSIYDLDDTQVDRLRFNTPDGPREVLVGKSTLGDEQHTIVNTQDDTIAYAIPGMLGMYADAPYSGWLPKYLVYGDPARWRRLYFTFPDGGSYTMENKGGLWYIQDRLLDQSKTLGYLRSLAKSRGQRLVDPRDTLTARSAFRLVVEDSTLTTPIVVLVAATAPDRFIVRSSLNPFSVMPFDPKTEIVRMFRPPYAFMADTASATGRP